MRVPTIARSPVAIPSEKVTGVYPLSTMDGAFGIILTIRSNPPSIPESWAMVSLGMSDMTIASGLSAGAITPSTFPASGGWTAMMTRSWPAARAFWSCSSHPWKFCGYLVKCPSAGVADNDVLREKARLPPSVQEDADYPPSPDTSD